MQRTSWTDFHWDHEFTEVEKMLFEEDRLRAMGLIQVGEDHGYIPLRSWATKEKTLRVLWRNPDGWWTDLTGEEANRVIRHIGVVPLGGTIGAMAAQSETPGIWLRLRWFHQWALDDTIGFRAIPGTDDAKPASYRYVRLTQNGWTDITDEDEDRIREVLGSLPASEYYPIKCNVYKARTFGSSDH